MAKNKAGKPIADRVAEAQQAVLDAGDSADADKLRAELAELEHEQAWGGADSVESAVVNEEPAAPVEEV